MKMQFLNVEFIVIQSPHIEGFGSKNQNALFKISVLTSFV
jgi:hypothetical protein